MNNINNTKDESHGLIASENQIKFGLGFNYQSEDNLNHVSALIQSVLATINAIAIENNGISHIKYNNDILSGSVGMDKQKKVFSVSLDVFTIENIATAPTKKSLDKGILTMKPELNASDIEGFMQTFCDKKI